MKKLTKQSCYGRGTLFQVVGSSEKVKYSHNDNLTPDELESNNAKYST